jgi:2-hydroxychromene-2-carboxylate isomerase
MAHIDYFLTTFSPWAYLAGMRLEENAAKQGATITYKPLDMLALFDRTGGVRPAARHPNRMAYRMQELKRWSKALGMPMNFTPSNYPPNPAPASYALIAAQNAHAATGTGDLGGLCHAILRAVWAEEGNIAEDAVLRAALTANGFDPNLVTTGLFDGAVTYEKNLEEAVERGVFGAPFYIIRDTDERFWGQDRLALLDAALADLAAGA